MITLYTNSHVNLWPCACPVEIKITDYDLWVVQWSILVTCIGDTEVLQGPIRTLLFVSDPGRKGHWQFQRIQKVWKGFQLPFRNHGFQNMFVIISPALQSCCFTIIFAHKQIDFSFLCMCPLIDDKLHHNIVKGAVEPQATGEFLHEFYLWYYETAYWPLWWCVLIVDKRTDHSKPHSICVESGD